MDLAGRSGWRLDLTRDGRFGLSEASVEAVSGLERPLVARVFFTEDLEPPFHQHRQALLDLLGELARRSGGRLRVDAVDPAGDPARAAEAAKLGVHPVPYAVRSWDRTEARAVFLGVSFQYGERQAAVESLPSLARMEQDVTRALREVTGGPDARPTLGWWVGHGEPDPAAPPPGTPLAELLAQLRRRGALRAVPGGDLPVPPDVDVLLVVAPREPVPPADRVHLDRHLRRGGRILVFAGAREADVERLALREARHGLGPWLEALGVSFGEGVLADRDHPEALLLPVISAGSRRALPVTHPLALVTAALDREAPAVRGLPRLVLPIASPLELSEPLPPGVEAEVWARSEGGAVALPGLRSLDPGAARRPAAGERPGPFPVVVALSGRFPGSVADPAADSAAAEPSRVVVVGSGDAAANAVDLAMGAVDWLVEDEALAGIRARSAGDPPLRAPPREVALRAKLAMAGAPLLALGLGWLATARRRRDG